MKKNFFFLFLFSLFFFPFNSFAMSFVDCNNVEHQVEYHNYEDFRDWCYFTYFDDTKNYGLIVHHRNHNTACIIPETGTDIYYRTSDNCLHARTPFKYKYVNIYNFDLVQNDLNDGGIDNLMNATMDYSSFDIYNDNNELYFSSNFSINDIKTKYNCPGSVTPTPEEPTPEEPETGPTISQNDFYVLLVMLSTLIWLLYFKWCFPLTRGRDL